MKSIKEIFMKDKLYQQVTAVMQEFGEKAKLKKGNLIVVGCSTSEILGSKIGTNSCPDVAKIVFEAIFDYTSKNGLRLAIQCCEHLNRALISDRSYLPFLDEVNVIPQPKAGGSLATQAYAHFAYPIAVEDIKADAGLDIGLTLIGMHLKKVAVPVRLENNRIGEALVVAARTRAKFVGGSRAVYNENLL